MAKNDQRPPDIRYQRRRYRYCDGPVLSPSRNGDLERGLLLRGTLP